MLVCDTVSGSLEGCPDIKINCHQTHYPKTCVCFLGALRKLAVLLHVGMCTASEWMLPVKRLHSVRVQELILRQVLPFRRTNISPGR